MKVKLIRSDVKLSCLLVGMTLNILNDWHDDVLFNILVQCLDKWCPHFLDSTLKPDVIMEEVSFTSQNSQVHSKVVILTVDNRN